MQLNTLSTNSGIKTARRVGRGGKRGKTSGKGHKGQKARAGRKLRPAERDMIKSIPKRRGFGKNRGRTVNQSKERSVAVNLVALERVCVAGERVTPASLVAHGLVHAQSGKPPMVKILSVGTLTKKLSIVNCAVSATARAAIEKVGGEIL